MNDTVAHDATKRPSKSVRKTKPLEQRAPLRTQGFRDAENARTCGLACIESVRDMMPMIFSGQLLGTKGPDELRAMVEDVATDLEGAEEALLALADRALPASSALVPPARPDMALDCAGKIIPLRHAVDEVIGDVDGIARECRAALDRACALHVYGAGRRQSEDGLFPASEDVEGDFNKNMAEAVGALQCLLKYVDQLRPESLELRRANLALASREPMNDLDAAAEE